MKAVPPLGVPSTAATDQPGNPPVHRHRTTDVDVETASKLARDDEYLLVDVRTTKEWNAGHPPNAIHMLLETIPDRIEELSGKTVLAFCRSGVRSDAAAEYLKQHEVEAHNVTGGVLAWARAGLPLEMGSDA